MKSKKEVAIEILAALVIWIVILLGIGVLLCTGGCTTKTIKTPQGLEYTVTRFLTREQLGYVEYNPRTGLFKIRQFNSQTEEIALTYLGMGIKLGQGTQERNTNE